MRPSATPPRPCCHIPIAIRPPSRLVVHVDKRPRRSAFVRLHPRLTFMSTSTSDQPPATSPAHDHKFSSHHTGTGKLHRGCMSHHLLTQTLPGLGPSLQPRSSKLHDRYPLSPHYRCLSPCICMHPSLTPEKIKNRLSALTCTSTRRRFTSALGAPTRRPPGETGYVRPIGDGRLCGASVH